MRLAVRSTAIYRKLLENDSFLPVRKLRKSDISGTLFGRHRRQAAAPDFAFHFNDIPYFYTANTTIKHGRGHEATSQEKAVPRIGSGGSPARIGTGGGLTNEGEYYRIRVIN